MTKTLRILALCLSAVIPALAAAPDPVQWTLAFEPASAAPGGKLLGKLTATVDSGWHVYSLTTPPGGPRPTTITVADNPSLASFHIYQPKPERKLDPNFQIDTETYQGTIVFLVEVELKKDAPTGNLDITAQPRYQTCSDKVCLPPKRKTATATIKVDSSASAAVIAIPADYTEVKPAASAPPVQAPAKPRVDKQDLASFILTAFVLGLASIFTPCVFPMIPITVSFFLNRKSSQDQSVARREGITHAALFCIGIVVLFTGLGWLAKAIAGPFGVVLLGSNPWVNGFITTVFVIFGLSLLGAFELTLPSGLLTKLNSASDGGGYAGTLVMGLTFTLTSFACIGPIVGPLFVASVQTDGLQPVFGMFAFATGLAAPFFVLALFPSYLQRLPRSGAWMIRVKVVLGFLVLAAAVNYLNKTNEALQIGWLTRERYLAAWIVLFTLPGLYLLGLLRMEGIKADEKLGVGRALLAAVLLMFGISLLPGMFGSPLGELDAYIPPPLVSSRGGSEQQLTWIQDDYKKALDQARQEGKLVFVDFSGHACTNCHWMERNMIPKPEIQALLKNFVLVQLYTDGTDQISEQNQKLQESKFQTIAIPYYAILDPNEKVIATFPGLTRDPKEFVAFLTVSPSRSLTSTGPRPESFPASAPPGFGRGPGFGERARMGRLLDTRSRSLPIGHPDHDKVSSTKWRRCPLTVAASSANESTRRVSSGSIRASRCPRAAPCLASSQVS